jgi:cytochrome c-type biogenesis protein CcmH/NrfG
MASELTSPAASGQGWRPVQAYAMAAICLLLGAALGYLFRASGAVHNPARNPQNTQSMVQSVASTGGAPTMPSLDDMKRMADKQAEPLLAKLKSDPNNVSLLVQVARMYESTHQFPEAGGYFGRAVQADPKNVALRTEMASCLYYGGDVDGAINQLQQAVQEKPGDANALFNLGLIRWKGKGDTKGALEAWKQLMSSNPNLDAKKKAELEKVMAAVQQGGAK